MTKSGGLSDSTQDGRWLGVVGGLWCLYLAYVLGVALYYSLNGGM